MLGGKKVVNEIEKFAHETLGFLDSPIVLYTLIAFVIAYIAGVVPMLTHEVASIFNMPIVKVLTLLFIVFVAMKNVPLALALVIAYVLSVQMHLRLLDDQDDPARTVTVTRVESEPGVVEGMDGDNNDKLIGGNYETYPSLDCVKDCADHGGRTTSFQCKGYSKFGGDAMNAQGLECPVGGFDMNLDKAPFN